MYRISCALTLFSSEPHHILFAFGSMIFWLSAASNCVVLTSGLDSS